MGGGVSQKGPPLCIAALLKNAPGEDSGKQNRIPSTNGEIMRRKIAALGATLLLVLAIVGFSGTGQKPSDEPAQAWYYSSCTATGMNGIKYCYKVCGSMEKYWTPYCGQWEPINVWNA